MRSCVKAHESKRPHAAAAKPSATAGASNAPAATLTCMAWSPRVRSGAAAGVAGTRIERTGARKAAGACARTVGEGTNVWCAIASKGNINQAEGAQQVRAGPT